MEISLPSRSKPVRWTSLGPHDRPRQIGHREAALARTSHSPVALGDRRVDDDARGPRRCRRRTAASARRPGGRPARRRGPSYMVSSMSSASRAQGGVDLGDLDAGAAGPGSPKSADGERGHRRKLRGRQRVDLDAEAARAAGALRRGRRTACVVGRPDQPAAVGRAEHLAPASAHGRSRVDERRAASPGHERPAP